MLDTSHNIDELRKAALVELHAEIEAHQRANSAAGARMSALIQIVQKTDVSKRANFHSGGECFKPFALQHVARLVSEGVTTCRIFGAHQIELFDE